MNDGLSVMLHQTLIYSSILYIVFETCSQLLTKFESSFCFIEILKSILSNQAQVSIIFLIN